MRPELPTLVVLFFLYSLLGYILECVVLSIDKRRLVMDRGFTGHLPFCIIYGFGILAGYALLHPFADNLVLLFMLGAVGATVFEYLTARAQLRLFGSFWWDYTEKPFNYKGILCLESTIGWGVAAILVVKLIHLPMVDLVQKIPLQVAAPLAVLLAAAYVVDFAHSARQATRQRQVAQQSDRIYFDG